REGGDGGPDVRQDVRRRPESVARVSPAAVFPLRLEQEIESAPRCDVGVRRRRARAGGNAFEGLEEEILRVMDEGPLRKGVVRPDEVRGRAPGPRRFRMFFHHRAEPGRGIFSGPEVDGREIVKSLGGRFPFKNPARLIEALEAEEGGSPMESRPSALQQRLEFSRATEEERLLI